MKQEIYRDDKKTLKERLYEKMCAEQKEYTDWLKSLQPDDILNQAYDYSIREDILTEMEYINLSDDQIKALLESNSPVSEIFQRFNRKATEHMYDIQDSIKDSSDTLIKRSEEKTQAMSLKKQAGKLI